MRRISIVSILCLSICLISCAESQRSTNRNLAPLTPNESGGKCSSQVKADLKNMSDICNIKGYSWQKNDIFMSCLSEINAVQMSYPKINCSIDGKKQTAKSINSLSKDFKNRIYQYKLGRCGSEPILKYNELFEGYDPSADGEKKELADSLDDFADRYQGINCETKENEIKLSSSPNKIQLTRELINRIRQDLLGKIEIEIEIDEDTLVDI